MGIFDWLKSKDDTSTPAKRQPRRPQTRDWTEALVANRALTQGLYHNTYPGLKLAGALAYAPIAVPVFFMGVPIAVVDNETVQETISAFVESVIHEMTSIHVQCHREGTVWVWPRYNVEDQAVVWEFIPDDSVTDILRDVQTGKVIRIITDEDIKLSTGYNTSAYVRRRRTFDADRVVVEWLSGQSAVPSGIENEAYRNPVGVLPIAFANNQDGDQIRGHSDYERIIPDLKSYHDIDNQEAKILAKFTPKMVQQGNSDIDTWLSNNGWTSIADIDVAETDFIFNRGEQESTEYIFPSSIETTYEQALKRRYMKIVEGSGVPEIIWGVKTEGNHASAEEQMDVFVKYVEAKREPKNDPYMQLFRASLMLMTTAGQLSDVPDMKIEWNNLDALSEKTKSEIFANFARGVAALADAAALTKEQLHRFYLDLYPDATDENYAEFISGLSDMAKHRAFKSAEYVDILDLSGDTAETIDNDEG